MIFMIIFRIFIILLIFLLYSSKSFSDWIKLTNSKTGSIYVDFNKIKVKDGLTYFWYLMDFKEKRYLPSKKKYYQSFVIQGQGDCDLSRFKDLQFVVYKSKMGKDYLLNFEPPNKWKYPPPGSNYLRMLESVCIKSTQ